MNRWTILLRQASPVRLSVRRAGGKQDLITVVGDLRRRQVGFTSLHENLDTTTPGGRLVFHVFAALAEFIRELIISGTREGLAAARERGRVGGRPTVVTPGIIRAARDMLPNPEHSVTSIAKLLGVSPGTLYNHIPDLRELRAPRSRPVRARITGPRSGTPPELMARLQHQNLPELPGQDHR